MQNGEEADGLCHAGTLVLAERKVGGEGRKIVGKQVSRPE